MKLKHFSLIFSVIGIACLYFLATLSQPIGALVLLFTGIMGPLILIIATFIGLIPIHWGVRRSHCMGVLLIPVILYFL